MLFSDVRGDEKAINLLNGNTELQRFHQKCYDTYTHAKALAKFQCASSASSLDSSSEKCLEQDDSARRVSSRKKDRSDK